jgi:hypothetical protein
MASKHNTNINNQYHKPQPALHWQQEPPTKTEGIMGNSTTRNAFFKLPPILKRLHFFSLPTSDLAPRKRVAQCCGFVCVKK